MTGEKPVSKQPSVALLLSGGALGQRRLLLLEVERQADHAQCRAEIKETGREERLCFHPVAMGGNDGASETGGRTVPCLDVVLIIDSLCRNIGSGFQNPCRQREESWQ